MEPGSSKRLSGSIFDVLHISNRLSKGLNKSLILCPCFPFFFRIPIRISLLHKIRPAGHHFLSQCMIVLGHRAPAAVQGSEGVPQF